MIDIPNYKDFTKIEPINKGWSSDKKYYIETINGEKLLLRVSDISEYNKKKAEFEAVKLVAEQGVSMSQPIDFGVCNDGNSIYTLLSWAEGKDAEVVISTLSENEQYELGVKAGELLAKIHSIPAPKGQVEVNTMLKQASDVLHWYEDMTNIIPKWYIEGSPSCKKDLEDLKKVE